MSAVVLGTVELGSQIVGALVGGQKCGLDSDLLSSTQMHGRASLLRLPHVGSVCLRVAGRIEDSDAWIVCLDVGEVVLEDLLPELVR